MSGIVIVSDANFIEITFHGNHSYMMMTQLRISLIGSVSCLLNGEGVQIVTHDIKPIIMQYGNIESVDGDTSITTDMMLCNKLKAMM